MTGRRQFGSIRKRDNGKWQATYTLDGRKRSAGIFRSKGGANAALSAIETKVRSGTWIDPNAGHIFFANYVEAWLRGRNDLKPRSKEQYESLARNHLVPYFGHLRIGQIQPSDVRAWHGSLLATRPNSAPAAYRLLRSIFNVAVDDDLISRNPCRVKGAGSDRAPERPVPSVNEVQKLLLAMPERLQAAPLLAAGAGLRRGEVLGLQRRDIDLIEGSVQVERSLSELSDGHLLYGPTKTGGCRKVHVSPDVLAALESHLDAFVRPEADAPVFTGRTGQPLRPGALWRAWDKARRATGITDYHFHDLRHFDTTTFSAMGASLSEVMARGGWTTASMVLRYQHASAGDEYGYTGCSSQVRANVTETVVHNNKILVGLSIFDAQSSLDSGGPTQRWQILTVKGGLIVDIRGFEERVTAVSRME